MATPAFFSTQPLPKDQLVRLYFDKDLVEKAFRALKGVVKLQPILNMGFRSESSLTSLSVIWPISCWPCSNTA